MTYDQLHRLLLPLDPQSQSDILLAFRDLEDELATKDKLLRSCGVFTEPHVPVDPNYQPRASRR